MAIPQQLLHSKESSWKMILQWEMIIVKEKIVVKEGGSSSSGCVGDGVSSVYNQYGCRDSDSTNTGTKVKVVSYPESQPFPPERVSSSSAIANSKYGGIIYSQGKKPQSGSSESVRITVQSGKGIPACDKSSPSYNIRICNQQGQSSTSQGSSSFGTQGSKPQGGSSETVRITIQDQAPGSQAGSSSGTQQGGSYSSGSSACGQGTTSTNPCNPGQASSYNSQASSSQSQGNSNACIPGKDTSYNNNRC
ncbi:uncharacterized protein LOC134402571 [Elgaria multicarinata webbii]|uniref:uncharacterized protein LOC134402571 n=1 Tax=Elgaria multicarinata webbii TaxID=159646 RepID=UPI002FCCF866